MTQGSHRLGGRQMSINQPRDNLQASATQNMGILQRLTLIGPYLQSRPSYSACTRSKQHISVLYKTLSSCVKVIAAAAATRRGVCKLHSYHKDHNKTHAVINTQSPTVQPNLPHAWMRHVDALWGHHLLSME